MPLIDRIAAGALDEEYVEVAAGRGRAGRPGGDAPGGPRRPPLRPGVLAGVAVAVFAVLVTVSFQQTRDNADVVDAGRATLEERIRARRAVVEQAESRIVALRADNASSEATLDILDDTDDDAQARLVRLRDQVGLADVTGEGLRIVVGDNPDGDPSDRVYDEDLALLVNGLWEAGASAVSVNGNRLTVLSGFRFSGQAIRLNELNVSLSPPYTVLALGDTATLAADLLDTTSGLRFESRVDEFGFTRTMENVQRLALPAAPDRLATRLRWARTGPASADQDAPNTPGTTGTPDPQDTSTSREDDNP
jgi:uncharacterized protein YlxW (UPF0749 family)